MRLLARILVLVAGLPILLSGGVTAALAQEAPTEKCVPGTRGPATLDLDEDDSKTSLDFGRRTAPDSLVLFFDLGVCKIGPADSASIPARPEPPDDLRDAVRIVEKHANGTLLVVRLRVDPKLFTPGEYSFQVLVGGGLFVTPGRFSVTVSRSESNPAWPLGAALAGTLGGLLYALFVVSSTHQNWKRIAAMAVAALAAGAVILKQQYFDAGSWTLDLLPVGSLLVAAAAAATGAAVAAMKKEAE